MLQTFQYLGLEFILCDVSITLLIKRNSCILSSHFLSYPLKWLRMALNFWPCFQFLSYSLQGFRPGPPHQLFQLLLFSAHSIPSFLSSLSSQCRCETCFQGKRFLFFFLHFCVMEVEPRPVTARQVFYLWATFLVLPGGKFNISMENILHLHKDADV